MTSDYFLIQKFRELFEIPDSVEICKEKTYMGEDCLHYKATHLPRYVISLENFKIILDFMEEFSSVYKFDFASYDSDKRHFEFCISQNDSDSYTDIILEHFDDHKLFFEGMLKLKKENNLFREIDTARNKRKI